MKKEVIEFLLSYLKEYKTRYIIGIIFVFIASILGVFVGYLSGLSIEKITTMEFMVAIIVLIVYLIFNLLKSYFRKLSNLIFHKTSNDVMEKITYNVFEKIGLLPARAFEEKTSGEFINLVTSDATNIVSNISQIIFLSSDIVAAIVISIYILINSPIIFLEIIIYLVIFYFYSQKYMPLIKNNQKKMKTIIDNTTTKISESVRGVREIRALGIRESINKNVNKDIKKLFKKRNEASVFSEKYYYTIRNMNYIFEATVYISSIILFIFDLVSLTFVIALTWYIFNFMFLFESFTSISTNFQTLMVSAERLLNILNNSLYKDIEFGNVNKRVEGNIEFKNVTFKYSEDENNILKNFNLKIEKNKVTALVGKSGGGKTTLFNLLLRYFDVSKGEVLIDGINIKDFSEKSLSNNIAIIRQDPFLFNLSIFDNFKILDKNITLKKVREYCKLSEIDDYIMSLPKGYDTLIGEGGINLSGGQKQRIAIARALMKKSKILLLDEATSALDNINQEKIKQVIFKLSKDHTVIVVAHRLSTIVDADVIHFIQNGKIKYSGTHNELLESSKDYKSLYFNNEV